MRDVKPVRVGNCVLDGRHIYIQSMLNARSDDIEGSVRQAVELEKAGCEVDTCVNDQEAVDYMSQACDKKVDFILMDLMMPVMDGLEATKLIRCLADKEAAQTIIIALTANAMNETKQEIVAVGMNGMLNKPFDVKALQGVLWEILQRSKQ